MSCQVLSRLNENTARPTDGNTYIASAYWKKLWPQTTGIRPTPHNVPQTVQRLKDALHRYGNTVRQPLGIPEQGGLSSRAAESRRLRLAGSRWRVRYVRAQRATSSAPVRSRLATRLTMTLSTISATASADRDNGCSSDDTIEPVR